MIPSQPSIQIWLFPLLMFCVLTFVDAESSYDKAIDMLQEECNSTVTNANRYFDRETTNCYTVHFDQNQKMLDYTWVNASKFCESGIKSTSAKFQTEGNILTGPLATEKIKSLMTQVKVPEDMKIWMNAKRDTDGTIKWQSDKTPVKNSKDLPFVENTDKGYDCIEFNVNLLNNMPCNNKLATRKFICQLGAIHCKVPSGQYAPQVVTPSTKNGKLIVTETATYACDVGFFIAGAATDVTKQTVTFLANGTLEPNLQPCVVKKPDTTTTTTTTADREQLGKNSGCLGGPLNLPSNVKYLFNPTTIYPHNDNLVYPVECPKQQYVVGLAKVTRIQFIKCLNGNWTELMQCAERSCPNTVAAWAVSYILVMLLVSAVAVPLIVLAYRKLETFDEDDENEPPENASTDGRKNLADLMSEDQTVKPGTDEPTEATTENQTAATEQTTSGFTEAKSKTKTSGSTKSDKTSKSAKKSKSSKSKDF